MPERVLRKFGVGTSLDFTLFETDGINLKTDATYVSGDVKIRKDESSEVNTTNGFIDRGSSYSIALTAAELEASRIYVPIIDQGTKAWLDEYLMIETYGNPSAMHPFDLGADLSDYNETWKFKQIDIQNDAGSALVAKSIGGAGHGIDTSGNDIGHGINALGGSIGSGMKLDGAIGLDATSTSGNAISAIGGGINGNGIYASGDGTGAGLYTEGGATGHGFQMKGGISGGDGFNSIAQAGNGAGMYLRGEGTGSDLDVPGILTLDTIVDGTTLEYAFMLMMARVNGRYLVNTPTGGDIRFFRRDDTTELTRVHVTAAGRTRTF